MSPPRAAAERLLPRIEPGDARRLPTSRVALAESHQGLIAHLKERGILAVFRYLPLHLSEMGRSYGRAIDTSITSWSVIFRMLNGTEADPTIWRKGPPVLPADLVGQDRPGFAFL